MTILFKSEEKTIEGELAACYMQVVKEGEKFILSQVIVDDGEESEFELESHGSLADAIDAANNY